MSEVGSGALERSMLKGDDVFILDTPGEVFVWVGKGASDVERKAGMAHGMQCAATQP